MKPEKELIKKRAKGIATHVKPLSQSAEQFHMLFEALDLNKYKSFSILLTSPDQGEGTSTAASNLAIVAAQTGHKVLLVDANLRKPSLHQVYNLDNKVGLTDLLSGKRVLENTVHLPGVDNLAVLPSGQRPENSHPAGLLHSPRMNAWMKEAKQQYDLIILDTPAIIPYSEGQVLAEVSDAAILVVKNRNTLKLNAVKAKERLESSNIDLLGVVFNDQTSKRKLKQA